MLVMQSNIENCCKSKLT